MLDFPGSNIEPHIEPEIPVIQRAVKRRPPQVWPYLVPGLLLLSLLIGVFILGFGIGVDRGKRSANEDREAFYQDRLARLGNSTAASGNPGSLPLAGNGPVQLVARVDRLEGDKITALLLGPNGTPTGATLVFLLTKNVQVYKSFDLQPSELHPGDNIVFNGTKTGENFTPRFLVLLPPAT